MNAGQSKPNQKRRQRKNKHKSKHPTKITDLNDNCLEKIFGYLDVCDLMNVAISNEWLRPAAGVVYKRNIGEKQVCLVINNWHRRNWFHPVPYTYIVDDSLHMNGLKKCLQYVRCLGSSTSNLSIWYGDAKEKQCDHIHQYVNEYCTESLVNIEFRNKQASLQIKNHFKKPFVNVRTVKFHRSILGDKFPLIQQWFPNMGSFNFYVNRTLCSVDTPFHHLEDLRIEIGDIRKKFIPERIIRLLQQCPQLHSLKILMRPDVGVSVKITLDELLSAIKDKPNFCTLSVMQFKLTPAMSDIQQLVMEHSALVKLDLIGYEFTAEAVMVMIRQITSLEYFRFKVSSRSDYDLIVSQLDDQWQPPFPYFRNYVTLQR